MKNYLITLLLFITVGVSNAQNQENLVGKWEYVEMIVEENDEEKSKMMKALFGNIKLEFTKEGKYIVTMMGKEEKGTWTISGLVVTQTSSAGKATEMVLRSLSKDELVFDLQAKSKSALKLKKVDEFKVAKVASKVEVKKVAASADQIKGTWYFKGKEMSGNDETAFAEIMIIGMFENAYFNFNDDGSYEDDASLGEVTKGTWKFEENNTELVITKKKEIRYSIVKISDEEMGLVGNVFGGVMTFVRTKPSK